MDLQDLLILIDGDNVNFTYFQSVLTWAEQAGYSVKGVHLFGKLNSKYIQDWKAFFSTWPFISQYPVCENHKNAADIQMMAVIYKMYYEEHQRCFMILSSDSDFSYLLTQIPTDTKFIIGYSPEKVSAAYLDFLNEHGIQSLNLDDLRGPITPGLMKDIVNTVLQAYLEFKLSPEYFSYDTLLSWITNRYGNIGFESSASVREFCEDKQLVFDERGVHVKSMDS